MYDRYVVKTGDTIEGIAKQFNISVEELKRINGIQPGMTLIMGRELLIPKTEPETTQQPPAGLNNNFFTYTVKAGDTLYAIGSQYNVRPEILALINGLDVYAYIYPGQSLIIPREDVKIHIVEPGETFTDVTKRFQTTPEKLLALNKEIYLLPEQMIIFK
ncbi:MAG: LysM peptidoglycan-binding domain-containing protein [Bacilli bacterium]|jgi:LysM repeat protein